MRTEWSIYHEEMAVAGQIDSLWRDDNKYVLMDWKRSGKKLSTNQQVLREQTYDGKCGISHCTDLYDTTTNHYLIQQGLYSYILKAKYNITIDACLLLQLHRDVTGIGYNELELHDVSETIELIVNDCIKIEDV